MNKETEILRKDLEKIKTLIQNERLSAEDTIGMIAEIVEYY